MCLFDEKLRTVRRGIFVLFLAVCFLLIPNLTRAQGVRIELDCRSLYYIPIEPQKEKGLSISTSPPLLRSRLRFSRQVDVDYDIGYATIHDKMGLYSIYHPVSLELYTYIQINNESKYQQGWLSTVESSLKREQRDKGGGLLNFEIPVKFPKLVTKLIGEGGPGLRVNGSRKIIFSGKSSWQEGLKNTATSRQSKFPSLNMEQISKFTITGNVGTRVSVKVDQDSKRQSDLENTMHLKYTGDEDGIVQSIEAGNTTLSMRSGLMGYSQSVKGLFGIKAQTKFGGLDLTMIASQEKGSTQKAEFEAGAETNEIIIRDWEYLPRTFFYLGQDILLGHGKDDFGVGDSIIYVRLYVSNNTATNNSELSHGIAYVDPTNIDTTSEEVEYRRFGEMDPSEYQLYLHKTKEITQNGTGSYTLPYVELSKSLNSQDVLAVYYEVLRSNGRVDTVGNLNYYYTGNTDDDTTYILKLIKHHYPKNDYITWEYEWRNVYYLRSKNMDPDGMEIDIYKGPKGGENINQDLNHQNGVRYLRLLGLDRYNTSGELVPDGVFDQSQLIIEKGYLFFPHRHPFASDISFTDNPEDTLKEKIYQIYDSNVQDVITEASKYYIHLTSATRKSEYSLGHAPIIEGSEVVTLNGRRLNQGSEYTITYEIGLIRFLTDEALNPDARVSVDYEYAPLFMPERKSLFGLQGKYDFGDKLDFDWVTLYKSEKSTEDRPRVGEEPTKNLGWGGTLTYNTPSRFLTNMIDALPLLETETESRINFTFQGGGNVPNPNTKDKAFIDDFESALDYTDLGIRRGTWTLSSLPNTYSQRARMYWYNPYDQVRIDEIWPNKEAWRGENRTNVLNIVFLPDRPHAPVDTLIGNQVCNGIMRPFSQGNYDQSRKRFLEIWVRGDLGTLHVDLGQISEDVIINAKVDTEDKLRNGQRDGILDEDEDTGFDTLKSSMEPGHEKYSDPNGDDFEYDSDDRSLRYDYTKINGTEGNIDDPDRGRRPDTEDINYNGILDDYDNYFEYTIDLSSMDWVEGTYNNGWRLYRIPLKDSSTTYYSEVGEPDWNTIQFARLWITSPESTLVQIASIQLVGNKWLNSGITTPEEKRIPDREHRDSFIGGGDYLSWMEQRPGESKFEIFVTNTHENVDYYPPPNVAGILDRKTKVREKEQSLVLRFEELKPYEIGSAYRVLYSTEDYTDYHKMSMWIHGPENTSDILFFFRMGLDSTNYYEYHTEVTPGWNEMVIDFSQITALKINMEEDTKYITQDNYAVKGSPSLSRIIWFSCGVENMNPDSSISGEVWIDELIVADVRKVPGFAGNATLSLNLADFSAFSLKLNKKDSEFRDLVSEKGSGVNQTTLGIQNNMNLEKLLPPTWGFRLPLRLSWTKNTSVPRLKTGSDVIIPSELRDSETSETVTRSISFSESFNKNTQNWLLNLTLNRMSTGFSYSENNSRSPLVPINESRTYNWNLNYNLSPGRKLSFPILSWLKLPLVPSTLTGTRLYLLPSSMGGGGTINGTRSHSENQAGNVTDKYVKDFNGKANIILKPINALDAKYTFNIERDIRGKESFKFSFNPKEFKLGKEITRGQTFNLTYNPTLFDFLTHRFTFNSSYNEDSDPQRHLGTRSAKNSNTRSFDVNLNLNKILGRSSSPPRSDTSKSGFKIMPLSWLRFFTSRIDPITGSYKRSTNSTVSGLLDRPSWAYQFGLTSNPNASSKIDPSRGASDASSVTKNYSLGTGTKISHQISVTFRYNWGASWTASSSKPVKNISETFPDLTFNWNGLEKFKYINKMLSSLSYKFGYTRKVDKSVELSTKNPLSRNVDKRFSPLAYFNCSWKNGIKTTINITRGINENRDLRQIGGSQSVSIGYETTYKITSSYSFSAPQGIKVPFLRKIKFQSNLSLSLDISKKDSKQKSSVQGQPFNVKANSTQLILGLRGGYSFSSNVNGGLILGWTDTHDKKTGAKNHTREVGIWIEFKF